MRDAILLWAMFGAGALAGYGLRGFRVSQEKLRMLRRIEDKVREAQRGSHAPK